MYKVASDWSDGAIRSAGRILVTQEAASLSSNQISTITRAMRELLPWLPTGAFSNIETFLNAGDYNRRIRSERVYTSCEVFHYAYTDLLSKNQGFPISLFSSLTTNSPTQGDQDNPGSPGSIDVNFVLVNEDKRAIMKRYASRLNWALRDIIGQSSRFIVNEYLSLRILDTTTQHELYPFFYILTQRHALNSFFRNCIKYGNPT